MEHSLVNNAFVHGVTVDGEPNTSDFIAQDWGPGERVPRFNGVTIDTAANRMSIMSRSQYHAYQMEFGRKVPMRLPKRDVKGIGGKSMSIGEVTIQLNLDTLQRLGRASKSTFRLFNFGW